MAKIRTVFNCHECGYKTYKWAGYCPVCKGDTLVEEQVVPADKSPRLAGEGGELTLLEQIPSLEQERLLTGIKELDRVLGGGTVPGSVVLVGGDPGIGKSTLLLQAALGFVSSGLQVIYVTGEESLAQLKMRAARLGLNGQSLLVLADTEYSRIESKITEGRPQVVVIDSIQTVMKKELGGVPGSVIQLREVTASLVQLAKSKQITFFIIGHVTKEGVLAGPRILEHMVDCVLNFEGDRYQSFRILRAAKNRFGSTSELGIFTMEAEGLTEVQNPSALFLSERPAFSPGSAVVPVMEGSRPLLVEVQGLVSPSYSGGIPRRTATGLDINRASLLIAVLEKRVGLPLTSCDIFINVVGGVKIMEPAVDLAVALALASSYRDKPLKTRTMFVGEVGLTGEVRPVGRLAERLQEGLKMGYTCCILPRGNLRSQFFREQQAKNNLELVPVSSLAEALDLAME